MKSKLNIKALIQNSLQEQNIIVKNIVVQEKELNGCPKKVIILGKGNNDKFLIAEVRIKGERCEMEKPQYFKGFVSAMSEYAKYKRKTV